MPSETGHGRVPICRSERDEEVLALPTVGLAGAEA
jgi:hypothetical protein